MSSRPSGRGRWSAAVVLWAFLAAAALQGQVRNRSLVAWGDGFLGLNRPPDLPPGVTANDVDSVVAGDLVSGIVLRDAILLGGTNYAGSRLLLRGPALLTGRPDGVVQYGPGSEDHADRTSWNVALRDAAGRMVSDRVDFGNLFGALIRRPTNAPSPIPSGRFRDQFPGDLAFFGDRISAGLPATDADPFGGYVAVSVSSTHVLALRADGTVSAFGGDNLFGERLVPSGVTGAVAVVAGEFFSAALLANGQVVAWGSDASGVVSVPLNATNVVSLRAGASHLVALRGDGSVVAWGNAADGRTSVPAGLSRVVKIAAGRGHTLALKDDGTVTAWGHNGSGQTSIPAGLVNVVDIAAGSQHNLVLVSRERPVLEAVLIRETSAAGVRDFDPAAHFTDRGRTLTFRVGLQNGAPPVQYRWRRNGVLVPGATNAQVSLTVGPSESGWFRMDAEAINAFGGDLRSVLVRIADSPAEVSIDAASFRAMPAPLAVPLGESSSGTALAVADPALSLAFVVRAEGDPQPTVTVYDSRTGDPVSAIDTPVTNATASVLGQSVVVTLRQLAVANSGNYLVVVGNALGKAVTNLVSVGIFPEITTPAVSSAVSPNPTVPSLLGPVAAGSTNVVFSVISAHGPSVTYQWLKDGSEIAKATNGTMALTNFSFVQIGSYSVRVSNPLTGSSLPADRSRGTAVSGGFTPVLAATVALSRTNILAPSGTAASLEIQLAGSLAGRVQLQRWDDVLGSWRDASATFPVTVPPLPAVWAPGGFFDLDLTGGGGRASFSVGTSALQPSMTGIYRVRAVQLTVPGGVELAGTEQIVAFPVTLISAADLGVPASPPAPVEGGGSWVPGSVPGVDLTIAAIAYSTVDLSAYLTVSGFPAPVFRWERQVSPASGAVPARYQVLVQATNSPRWLVGAVPTNAGIYRLVATNAIGGTTGVSRTIALRVDRVLRMPTQTLVSPGSAVELPLFLVGFGDESAVSFTLACDSPYLVTDESILTLTLDPALNATTTLSVRRLGSLVAPPANGGVGGNRFRLQVLLAQKDPTQGLPRGTNRIARLSFQAQTAESIGIIRNLGTSGVPVVPPLWVPVRVVPDAELQVTNRDLAFRVAYTNATQAPVAAEGGALAILADSVEGDVNGSGSVDVLDITSIAAQLAAGTVDTNLVTRRRIDCAPRSESGDWSINLADLVQVARYVAQLDPLQPAADPASGGPNYLLNRSRGSAVAKSLPWNRTAEPVRSLAYGWSDLVAGEEAWVPVILEGVGNENAFSFNLQFDPAALEFVGLRTPGNASFLENRRNAAEGRVGAVLWRPAGEAAPAGTSVRLEAGFRVKAKAGTTELRFGTVPLDSLIATVEARPVTEVRFSARQLSIAQRRRVLGGRVVGQTVSGSQWRLELEAVDSSGKVVSARDRRLRVRTSDSLGGSEASWRDSGLQPEITPTGNVRVPLSLDPTRASGFFQLVEE